jgi:hypothetical protein
VDGKISVATLVETIEAGALRTADPAGPRAQHHPGDRGRHGLHGARGAGAGGGRPREGPSGPHGRARFANAIARLGCTPAELTWKAGVDVLSFGATKNGALCAEAVVFFNRGLAETFRYRRRRAGHHYSKMRLISSSGSAFLENDLWLRNARHANAMAARVRPGPGRPSGHPASSTRRRSTSC